MSNSENIAGGHDFSAALDMIKSGARMARAGWNGRGMFVFLVPGSQFQVSREPLASILGVGTEIVYRPHIDLRGADATIGVWSPSMGDVMAEDWYEVAAAYIDMRDEAKPPSDPFVCEDEGCPHFGTPHGHAVG